MIKHVITAGALSLMPLLSSAYNIPENQDVDSMLQMRESVKTLNILPQIESLTSDKDEENAMKFLYAYMADPDMGAYSPEFYLDNVKATLLALDEMSWGKTLPQREAMHFVLPLRVNNESLDMSRPQFYEELKDRVKGLSMADAILEVNHWCHEKVTYKPSDGRTSSPLSTVSQAIGRCGEESTFTVAALRSVGIPARQVYTPRWAHTDDNHAWVEAWADGKWYFLGACEPEPVLNMAWFNAPASRGMLMNTNVFGKYDGPEESLAANRLGNSINVTANYTPVKETRVRVTDADGNAVVDADIYFCIYNYAEYYPIAKRKTDSSGEASLTTGIGDLIAWASDGKRFGIKQIKGNDESTALLQLSYPIGYEGDVTFDLIPPVPHRVAVNVSEAMKAENSSRLEYEDSLRNNYVAGFAQDNLIAETAEKLGLDKVRLGRVLIDSRGNHKKILDALSELPTDKREIALSLLENVTEKDRRDINPDVLKAHAVSYRPDTGYSDSYNQQFVLNPRIAYEALTDYRDSLRNNLTLINNGNEFTDPLQLAAFIADYIKIDPEWNPTHLRNEPLSVMKLKSGDSNARKILFVAAARSYSIPARYDMVRGEAQYLDKEGVWHDVLKDNSEIASVTPSGTLKLHYDKHGYLENPAYYYHFTISKIEEGLPRLLEYDEDVTTVATFANGLPVDAGYYLLTTGQRLADGSVLAKSCFFEVKEGETTVIPVDIRHDDSVVSVIGNLNSENLYRDLNENVEKSILSTTGRGYYVLGLLRNGHEPSIHTLNDISLMKETFEKNGIKCVILFEDGTGSGFDSSLYPNLPSDISFGEDINGNICREICESLNLKTDELPIFVIADTFNRIVFVSQGYSIGMGETICNTLEKIKE